MKLSIKERMYFGSLFQKESDLISMTLQKSISNKVDITEKDITECDIKTVKVEDKISYVWDSTKDAGIEVELSSKEVTYLQEQVKRLDTEKKITLELVDLCIKINELS